MMITFPFQIRSQVVLHAIGTRICTHCRTTLLDDIVSLLNSSKLAPEDTLAKTHLLIIESWQIRFQKRLLLLSSPCHDFSPSIIIELPI
jgi:hypothetical protein